MHELTGKLYIIKSFYFGPRNLNFTWK